MSEPSDSDSDSDSGIQPFTKSYEGIIQRIPAVTVPQPHPGNNNNIQYHAISRSPVKFSPTIHEEEAGGENNISTTKQEGLATALINSPFLQDKIEKLRRLASASAQGDNSTCKNKKKPKIQKAPTYGGAAAGNLTQSLFSPRFVSFGPIHHGHPKLQRGELYKLKWAATYLNHMTRSVNDPSSFLIQKILAKLGNLKECFSEEAVRYCNDEQLAWILLLDGCALLQILLGNGPDTMSQLDIKVDLLVFLISDMFLLENQLPLSILRFLLLSSSNTDQEVMPPLVELIQSMLRFITIISPVPLVQKQQEQMLQHFRDQNKYMDDENYICDNGPAHLLDLLRTAMLGEKRGQDQGKGDHVIVNVDKTVVAGNKSYRNVQELRASGIEFRPTNPGCLRGIYFKPKLLSGELRLPQLNVDDSTVGVLSNLIAYEMCPDFDNDYGVCSYVCFLDSLIDDDKDVKELRSARVLKNSLGSDADVALLFNEFHQGLTPDPLAYAHVMAGIEKHYSTQWKTWAAEAYHTYFSSPWAFLAFVGAVLALVLTAIQTWLTAFPNS